jgi:hypothetical protein
MSWLPSYFWHYSDGVADVKTIKLLLKPSIFYSRSQLVKASDWLTFSKNKWCIRLSSFFLAISQLKLSSTNDIHVIMGLVADAILLQKWFEFNIYHCVCRKLEYTNWVLWIIFEQLWNFMLWETSELPVPAFIFFERKCDNLINMRELIFHYIKKNFSILNISVVLKSNKIL